ALSGHGLPIRVVSTGVQDTQTTSADTSTSETFSRQTDNSLTDSDIAVARGSTNLPSISNFLLGDPCLVPIYHTDFAFPPEGGKIVKIDDHLYFVKTYQPGCANAGANGTVISTSGNNTGNSSSNSGSATSLSSLFEIDNCLVPVYNTNFVFPPEGGKIVKINNQLYFVKTYISGCSNAGANGTFVTSRSTSLLNSSAINTVTSSTQSNSIVGDPCLVPVFNTNFAFPPEGGKIVEINGQMYFVKTYESGCQNAGNSGTTINTTGSTNSTNQNTSQSSQQRIYITISYHSTNIYSATLTYNSSQTITALSALRKASSNGDFPLSVSLTSLGSYVSSIDGHRASGSSGWQYAVNGSVPDTSADNYILHNGDNVQWFYAAPGTNPY
ncbi:MAG TPA: DUF4430 domain-containing protein, partial [Methylomirabilota bacterium]|nr:DUF4430 domain-containing protein [Methylomirabilota bacterium]